VTPKRAFWEAFATVCLPSLVLWTILAYWLRSMLDFSYAETLLLCLFFALLPMPLAFPLYHRYLTGTPRTPEVRSPRRHIAFAILFAVIAIMHAAEVPGLIRSHKNGWDVVFHIGIATVWLSMSIDYVRRVARKQTTLPISET